MAIEYTLDQRLYRLNMTKKALHKQCVNRGKRISYERVCQSVNFPMETEPKYINLLREVVSEIEMERGITDIYFDAREGRG